MRSGVGQDDLKEIIRDSLGSSFLYVDEMKTVIQSFKHHLQESEEGSIQQILALQEADKAVSRSWLFGEFMSPKEHEIDYVQLIEKESCLLDAFPPVPVRSPKYCPVIFAHIFSGRRRPGDFQEAVERLGARAISIDIIFHITYGDLCRAETYALFKRAFCEDVIWGFLGGPPCETWSRARGRQLVTGESGPRRVRQVERPMGRLDLTEKEDRQVRLGSRLLGVAIRMLFLAALTSKTAILEHPAEDLHDLSQPSIWKLAILRLLLRFSTCRKIRVLQGHYKASSAKPTELMLVNVCDNAEQMLLNARCSEVPKATSIGKNVEGAWQTAHLKEYPEAFCSVLGEIFVSSQPSSASDLPVPSWFTHVCDELTSEFNLDAEMGMDYCGMDPNAN